jgi:hypothetical protein
MNSHVHYNNFVSVCDNFVDARNVIRLCGVLYWFLSVIVKEEHLLYWQRDVSDCMRVEVNH